MCKRSCGFTPDDAGQSYPDYLDRAEEIGVEPLGYEDGMLVVAVAS